MKKKDILERVIAAFERIYPLIRPRYQNLLAWIVVVGGLGVVSGPIWAPYLRAAVNRYLGLAVPEPPASWLGLLLVLFGLTYHFFVNYVEHLRNLVGRKKIIGHDSPLYANLRQIIRDDDFFWFISDLDGDHSYRRDHARKIDDVIYFLNSPSNQFLDPKLRENGENLSHVLRELREFLGGRFFCHPQNQIDRFCMQPEHNIDRGNPTPDQMKFYKELAENLDYLVERADSAYREFVDTAHKRLGEAALD